MGAVSRWLRTLDWPIEELQETCSHLVSQGTGRPVSCGAVRFGPTGGAVVFREGPEGPGSPRSLSKAMVLSGERQAELLLVGMLGKPAEPEEHLLIRRC